MIINQYIFYYHASRTTSNASFRRKNALGDTPPIKPSAFSVAGGGVLGDVLLMLGYPDDTDDYARIDIRRSAVAVAPANCESGTVVTTVTDFTSQVCPMRAFIQALKIVT